MSWLSRRYRPVEAIGSRVELAHDQLLDRRVLLKTAIDAPERDALAREVRLAAGTPHPAFRAVLDVDGGWPPAAAVFELVEGTAASEAIAQGEDPDRVAVEVLAALEHLHRAGFVHGDLKPEHVLVDARGVVRVIDLGLVVPLGTAPRGGTPRYLPPEYATGEPASAGGDLYSFGVAFEPLVARASPDVRDLVRACASRDPRHRPGSAIGCLSALGHMRRRLDVIGTFPLVGGDAVLDAARGAIARDRGETVVVRGERGSGVRRVAREIASLAIGAGRSVLAVRLPRDGARFGAMAAAFSRDAGDPTRDVAVVSAHAARDGVVAVVRVDDEADRGLLASISVAFARGAKGALVLVGEPPASLADDPTHIVGLPRARATEVREIFTVAGVRLDDVTVERVLETTGGRLGVVARLARGATHAPLRADDVVAAVAAVERPTGEARPTPSFAPPPGADDPGSRASMLAMGGRSEDAVRLLETLDAPTSADRLLLAQCLERTGDYRRAEVVARSLVDAPVVGMRCAAAATLAHVTLGLGRPEDAERIAARALPDAERLTDAATASLGLVRRPSEVVGRLHVLRSDAALQRGHHREALAHAEHALAHARREDSPALVAHACARVGGALSLAGRPTEAKTSFVEALRAAEDAGDLAVLPAFVMNLATAEHAASELASAIEHYQEAAHLSLRFGRRANWLAAAINLAGLWVFVGADVEARRLLDEARSAADETGAAIYAGQATLIQAESFRETDPARSRELARDAEIAFERAGATRQALEARLLDTEIGLTTETARATLRFVDVHREALDEAGLGARGSLVAARAHLLRDDAEAAKRDAETSAAAATAASDGELAARAYHLAAVASDRIAPGTGGALASSAKERLDAVARSLSPGMRERFLAARPRREVATYVAPGAVPATRGLSSDARRLLALVRRISSEEREARILERAVDEAVALTGAERAFLLVNREKGPAEVAVARNLDQETLRKSKLRFSRSVAERVLATGEMVVTASATEDPDLQSSRSILDLGLRSILCVPVPGRTGVLGALYLDHRYERGRFDAGEPELAAALADIVGVALQNARLLEGAARRGDELERHATAVLRESARRAHEVDRLTRALATARPEGADVHVEGGIVGRSPALARALDVARRVAPSDLAVLVVGESGTGKELLARFLHDRSDRATGPFVAINCGAVPEHLLESELFGHVRGAFTGATRDHAGLFREAHGGTIFLDEIGEMPTRMQTRLLRALQEGEVRAVGDTRSVTVDVRVVAATHRDLERAVRDGAFREDLYYRLVGARVVLPALRERREDIPDLCDAILARVAEKQGPRTIAPETYQALLRHDWPGNVRELEHTITRGAILARGPAIEPADLDLPGPTIGRAAALADREREVLVEALRATKGNRTEAAKILGMSRVTLHRRMKRHQVE